MNRNQKSKTMVHLQTAVVITALLLLPGMSAYGVQPQNRNNEGVVSRRALGAQTLRNLVAGTFVANSLTSLPENAVAAGDEVDVYFGVGCFWHIQHEVRKNGHNMYALLSNSRFDSCCLSHFVDMVSI